MRWTKVSWSSFFVALVILTVTVAPFEVAAVIGVDIIKEHLDQCLLPVLLKSVHQLARLLLIIATNLELVALRQLVSC